MLVEIVILVGFAVLLFPNIIDFFSIYYNKMADAIVNNPKKRQRRKRKASATVIHKSSTVIERKGVSPNWESFLKTQTKCEKKTDELKTDPIKLETSAYWKAKRLEKKANLKEVTSPSQHLKKLSLKQESAADSGAIKNIPKIKLFDKPANIEEIIKTNAYWKAKRLEKRDGVKEIKNAPYSNIEHVQIQNVGEDDLENVTRENFLKNKLPTLTKYVAMDCEMVGIGESGRESIVARVSIVNKFGDCIYDKFVKPREKVTDYRTPVSGVRKDDLVNGESFEVVQKEVAEILKERYLVGHAIRKDLQVLFLSHPKKKIRDTSKYKPFRKLAKGSTPSLKNLAKELLGVQIQSGEHSSVEDARATMQLYSSNQRHWEAAIRARDKKNN